MRSFRMPLPRNQPITRLSAASLATNRQTEPCPMATSSLATAASCSPQLWGGKRTHRTSRQVLIAVCQHDHKTQCLTSDGTWTNQHAHGDGCCFGTSHAQNCMTTCVRPCCNLERNCPPSPVLQRVLRAALPACGPGMQMRAPPLSTCRVPWPCAWLPL